MPRTQLVIRKATKDDLPSLNVLEEVTFDTYPISRRQMSYLARSASAIVLVAHVRGALAGDAIALMRRHASGEVTGRIYSLAVAPENRGKGIARKLMQILLARLKSRNAKRIHLEVEQANFSAVRLYEKLGFCVVQTLKHYYGREKHGLKMRLDG
jgi:ribosomal protein S18 acetylase RimI-like enzyme